MILSCVCVGDKFVFMVKGCNYGCKNNNNGLSSITFFQVYHKVNTRLFVALFCNKSQLPAYKQ